MSTVLVVYGTRPEAVKMAPVIAALRQTPGVRVSVAVTGQHRAMLDQVNRLFGIVPDHDLDISSPGQTLTDVTVRTLRGLERVLAADPADAVVVQGDTTTSTAAALAAFYARVPVAHVEAGLRTDDRWDPFPEEVNRRLTTRLADLHLAPTARARAALLREGVAAGDVVVTGNSVIDALQETVDGSDGYDSPELAHLDEHRTPVVLVTTHRRESWGGPMRAIAGAVRRLAERRPDVHVVLPMHLNPLVREALLPALAGVPNVQLCEPLGYADFCRVLARSSLVMTDSGGAQEEAPSLGRPVLVLRQTTERPEGVERGLARLVGTDEERVLAEAEAALAHPVPPRLTHEALRPSPYGDGRAGLRTAAAVAELLGIGTRLPDFREPRWVR
ncbi:non-hydrolyzing UDP-N-acetylglucosamine 2-epimerase [Geodermatophilus sp. CPCC 205506]|uniref:non-hydrolyzing UDP-N-acetylglucosamine 2-epimerase n=1 Tax=Geodermatophilus sp. CPCC 205506 TaxID=2936596 RepID=UPI003EEAC9B5